MHEFARFYALQETDHWTTSAMNVPGYIVYGTDDGRTAILCPRWLIAFVAHGLTMADVEQTPKMTPFITCEISLCQYVGEGFFPF